jgi:hypothetical protein
MLHGIWTLSSPLSYVWWLLWKGPNLGLTTFSCKGSNRLCKLFSLYCILNSSIVSVKKPQAIQKWVGMVVFQWNLIYKNRPWAGCIQDCSSPLWLKINSCHLKVKTCFIPCVRSNSLLIINKI